DLARAGITIEREPRPVHIRRLMWLGWDTTNPDRPSGVLEITCGAGTYIRSLAHDLGAVLGVGAHLTALARTRSGAFSVEQAVTLETLADLLDWSGVLVGLADGLGDEWPVVTLAGEPLDDVLHGRSVAAELAHPDETLALGMAADGALRAVLRAVDGRWQPHKVFPPGDEG
nr:pseudouridine synthase [Anaerolineae bacterium]